MKAYNVDDFSVLIGIDWADKKHEVVIMPPIITMLLFDLKYNA